MSGHRFFLAEPLAGEGESRLPLSAADLHHAVDVLRVRPGEVIDVVEPNSRAWRVRVTEAAREGVSAVVVEEACSAREVRVTLFQGMAKGRKMDVIVRQAVEIGAEEIVPVAFVRSIVRPDAEHVRQRVERFERIAEAAAKQSKRSRVPRIAEPVSLAEACDMLLRFDAAVTLWEECSARGIPEAIEASALEDAGGRVALVVGPEGGMTAEEAAALESAGAVQASLGTGILRTETAAVVGLALLVHALGGLGGTRG